MPDAVGSQQPTPRKVVCSPPMGDPAVAALPLTSAGFFLDTRAALHYKKHTHRRPLTAAWRGDGVADGAHEHDLAFSLYPPRLGADPTSGPSLCVHPSRRIDAAPCTCGRVGSAASGELHDLPAASLIRFTLQEATSASNHGPTPQSGWKTGPSRPSPGAPVSHDRACVAARAVRVWQHDVSPGTAVLHASGAGTPAHR